MQTFTVGEAARQIGVSVDTLRYYEREHLLFTTRTSSGHRRYGEDDLGWIRILTCLRETGMPIRRMREFAALVQQDESNIAQRVRLLESHRTEVLERMRALEGNLAHVEGKIEHYRRRLQEK
jgi:DNA-binding transcriptional MerR regulator